MKNVNVVSAAFYMGISAIVALLVFTGTLFGHYTTVDRAGAAIWVFLLSSIILMPIVIPAVKKRMDGRQ